MPALTLCRLVNLECFDVPGPMIDERRRTHPATSALRADVQRLATRSPPESNLEFLVRSDEDAVSRAPEPRIRRRRPSSPTRQRELEDIVRGHIILSPDHHRRGRAQYPASLALGLRTPLRRHQTSVFGARFAKGRARPNRDPGASPAGPTRWNRSMQRRAMRFVGDDHGRPSPWPG